ncbi:MAG: N-acetyl-alpha-D-glucosaminyl L-malate synthase BshA [Bacteroidia bacterium]|nr:N-acetyl-alpha-D-glucosaminyl L-malate synthase BshA [Bacteroidia bacterium]
MHIGIVCYPTFGGSGVVATELGKALAQKGHKVHFITYRQPARLDFFSENLYYHEVVVNDYPLFDYAPYELALTCKMVDVVKFEELDFLHVHYAIPHASAAYFAKQILKSQGIHINIITTLHGTDITLVGKDATYEPAVTFSINESDGVTAVSQSLKEDTFNNFDINNEIKVIPNFVDINRFQQKPKDYFKKATAPNNEKLIIHTSNFRKVKRVQDVVQIFKKINEKIASKLLLVGDGPERASIERLCRDLGVCDNIMFLGKQVAIEEILSVCDLFLLPSESESFGLAALEAMAAKVPVISSNTGGIPEINIHGTTGFLSNVGNVNEMAENAIKLLSDDVMLAQFQDNAYEQAKKFDLEKIMPLYEDFYREICEKNNCHEASTI